MNFEKINVDQFNYSLPEEKIAQFPQENRDESNLLIFWDEKIHHALVKELPNWISKLNHPNLILNDTKVVPADTPIPTVNPFSNGFIRDFDNIKVE